MQNGHISETFETIDIQACYILGFSMSRTDPSKSELVKLREHLLKKKKYQRWGAEGGEGDGGLKQ